MSVVLFTGAGASRPFDYPTTIEFYNAIDHGHIPMRDELLRHVNLLNKTNSDFLDVEDAFEFLENVIKIRNEPHGSFLSKISESDLGIPKITRFLEYSKELCLSKYSKPIHKNKVLDIYYPLLSKYQWEETPISLYTTNYDIIPDHLNDICNDNKLGFYDGFRDGKWNQYGWKNQKNGLKVYHLHGSINWYKRDDQLFKFPIPDTTKSPNFIIFPGFKDNPEERDEYYHFLHSELRSDLYKTKYFIVIGFSFRDTHINSVIKDALQNNNELIIYILTPNNIPIRMTQLIAEHPSYEGRINHLKVRFEEAPSYINDLPNLLL